MPSTVLSVGVKEESRTGHPSSIMELPAGKAENNQIASTSQQIDEKPMSSYRFHVYYVERLQGRGERVLFKYIPLATRLPLSPAVTQETVSHPDSLLLLQISPSVFIFFTHAERLSSPHHTFKPITSIEQTSHPL